MLPFIQISMRPTQRQVEKINKNDKNLNGAPNALPGYEMLIICVLVRWLIGWLIGCCMSEHHSYESTMYGLPKMPPTSYRVASKSAS